MEQVMAAVRRAGEGLAAVHRGGSLRHRGPIDGVDEHEDVGERITLRFHPADPDRIEIEALCEPRLSTTMADYGQGAKDLRALLGAIDQQVTGANQVQ